MTLFDILGQILIGPLKLIFEVIFSFAYALLGNPGLAVVVLSLAMNVLVLPLYRRADRIQEEARDTENKLKDVVTHIKKTFSGDERMMILQTYYRQNNYNPLSVLSGSLSLLLEIPFFMAAYQFLSGVDLFRGVSFGPIADLSVPDGLLNVGGITLNLLPFVMTLVNVLSASLYLKGFPLKTKIQLYGMALFFLVFLYNSPAALVFYWTLNNVFSLFKTLFYKLPHSRLILNVLLAFGGAGCLGLGVALNGFWKSTLFILLGLLAQLSWLLPFLKKKLPALASPKEISPPKTSYFVIGALFLTVLVGLLIPSAYLAASPQEFIDAFYFYSPVWYGVETLCLAAGIFLVWMGVFYWLSPAKGRRIFVRTVWILCGVMLVNYLFFGTSLGVVSPNLEYTEGFGFALNETLLNLGAVLAVVALIFFLGKYFSRAVSTVLLVGTLAMAGMGTVSMVQVSAAAQETQAQVSQTGELPSFTLSKTGKNVVVLMLDRAISQFIPYIMEENPTLKKQFDGFTHYANTISYGAFTNFGTPPLYGGYDYTPVQMNQRDEERLVDKHNEALKVMPELFGKAGYEVTVIDPSYANYHWIPDLNIYNGMENVQGYLAEGMFNNVETRVQTVENRKRNFFFFSFMKTLPLPMQAVVYDEGHYRALPSVEGETDRVKPSFMSAYNVLKNMDFMTEISEGNENTYMFLRSNATHEPVVLQEPYFTPANTVDNSAYYPAEGKTISNGQSTVLLNDEYKISHYHANMSCLMQLGEWFDYLRQNGVYDNTRIIIVSDHGRDLGVFCDTPGLEDVELYQALLLVKDFGATGFTQNNNFMTNADVPFLSADSLLDSPVNPFSGNPLDGTEIKKEPQWVISSILWDITQNNGTQFLPAAWATVNPENVNDPSNWTFYSQESLHPPAN